MSSPDLTDADRQAVIDVINTPILSMGKYTPAMRTPRAPATEFTTFDGFA